MAPPAWDPTEPQQFRPTAAALHLRQSVSAAVVEPVRRTPPMLTDSPYRRFAMALFIAFTALACGGGTQLAVRYSPDYATSNGSFSVLGVFDNGRLSHEAWSDIGPTLSSPFSSALCETAWNDQLNAANPQLAMLVDEYTKDNGITDDLIRELSPMAKGTSILSITVLGHRRSSDLDKRKSSDSASAPAPARFGASTGGIGRGGMRGTGWAPPRLRDDDDSHDAYEISALLFSIPKKHSVVLLSMTHDGAELDNALREFATKLRSVLSTMSCTGWNLETPMALEGLRRLAKPADPIPRSD